MDVELLHWPAEEDRRAELGASGRSRLLLVAHDVPAPVTTDPAEDWIRLPVDERDLGARVETLVLRATTKPTLDEDGVLHHRSQRAALPPVEGRLMAALLERFGKVVGRERLLEQGWPGQRPRRNVLDVHVLRLRRRLEPLGLTIKTVRKRGYLLDGGT